MKKRSFLTLLLSSPLLTVFKGKKKTDELLRDQAKLGDIYDNVMTVEKLEELSRWAMKRRIAPIRLPDGRQCYAIGYKNSWHKHYV